MSVSEMVEWRIVLGEEGFVPIVPADPGKSGDDLLYESLTAMFGTGKR